MKVAKTVVQRAQAGQDIDDAMAHYLKESGAPLALRYVEALEAAVSHIGLHPTTGSPRYATELGLPGLRFWPLKRFPYLVFYVEHQDHIDVWRVLHGQRDMPVWLADPAP